MPLAEDRITELKYAYQVLDAPLSASPVSIKQSYRKLIKRWHPDRYPTGTPEHVEAEQMTKLINGVYPSIANAPLRYHIDAFPAAYVRNRQASHPSTDPTSQTFRQTLPRTDWLEFWIRFLFGAFWGALLGFHEWLFHYAEPGILILPIGLSLIFGLAAAQSGDNFWHSLLRRWWLWW
jgi:curved DNA-binding protein CbpA